MNIRLRNTSQIVQMDGTDCRVWEGETEDGLEIVAFIPRIAVARKQDAARLARMEAELIEVPAPRPAETWPARLLT